MPDLLWIVMLASTFGQSGPFEVPAPKSVASPAPEAKALGNTQQELNSGHGPRTTDQEPGSIPAGTRRALIVCGHPGNAEFERTYAAVLQGLCKGLAERAGFPAGEILVLSGTKAGEVAVAPGTRHGGPATREGIQTAVKELTGKLAPEDTLWVIVVGHAHFDGRRALLNLPGPDLDADEFGKLFEAVACREQVFFITTAVSGYAIRSLSKKGRVVIAATEADQEVNETVYPIMLALMLSEPVANDEFDQDHDGRQTLLDLYLIVSRKVLQAYADAENIPTEHAQLDDNGDGRGTEIQLDYLDEALGGRGLTGPRPPLPAGADGAWTATMGLNLQGLKGTDRDATEKGPGQ
ncbi:MAG: hypothetical protein MUE50_24990 [Pirellulaceae bacterium]|nr:hypothetical protein [Pirellulaceae bacterium]